MAISTRELWIGNENIHLLTKKRGQSEEINLIVKIILKLAITHKKKEKVCGKKKVKIILFIFLVFSALRVIMCLFILEITQVDNGEQKLTIEYQEIQENTIDVWEQALVASIH